MTIYQHSRGSIIDWSIEPGARKWLVPVWLVVSLYWPVMTVGGSEFRIDYPLTAILVLWLILKQRMRRETLLPTFFILLAIPLFVVGSLIGAHFGYDFSIATTLGFFRPLVLWMFWLEVLRFCRVSKVIQIIAVVMLPAAVLSILQIALPDVLGQFTIELFSSQSREATQHLMSATLISRAVSVFQLPANAALAFLLAVVAAFYSAQLKPIRQHRLIYAALGATYALAGVTTASKTFFLGAALLITYVVLTSVTERTFPLPVLIAVVALSGFLASVIQNLMEHNQAFQWQAMKQLAMAFGTDAFSSRFDPRGGNLAPAFLHWREYFITGLGGATPSYFIGDNLYLYVLARTGVLGLLGLIGAFSRGIILSVRSTKLEGKSVAIGLVLICAAGLGTPCLWSPRLAELAVFFVAASQSVSEVDPETTHVRGTERGTRAEKQEEA